MFVNDLFEKKKPEPEKPRNFVAKNAKMGGAGAHKDKKKADKQGDVKHKKDLAADLVESNRDYDQGFASPSAPALGNKAGFKRQELQHELGHEQNNIAIAINGKTWKVVPGRGRADSKEEWSHLNNMKSWADKKSASSGKKWTVHLTGAPATNEAKLATQDKENRFKAIKQRDQQQDRITHQAMNNVSDEVAEGQLELNTPDPVVVIQDLKGKMLDKINLSLAAQKYKLGNPQDIKKQLAHQNYTTIGNYVVVSPMTGQPQDATTQGVAEGKKPDNYHIVDKDGKPASLASYADKTSAEKDRDAKHPGAQVRQVGPRGKVKGVSEGNLGHVLPWPAFVNKISSAMKAMGWKGQQRKDTGAFMFSTKGQLDDEFYIAIIDNEGNGMFTYALGTVEEGDPHIGEKDTLPITEASVSELMTAIREGFGLADTVSENQNPYGYEVGQTVKLHNGAQGRVLDIFDDSIEVLLLGGRTVTVAFQDANVLDEGGKLHGGEFRPVPDYKPMLDKMMGSQGKLPTTPRPPVPPYVAPNAPAELKAGDIIGYSIPGTKMVPTKVKVLKLLSGDRAMVVTSSKRRIEQNNGNPVITIGPLKDLEIQNPYKELSTKPVARPNSNAVMKEGAEDWLPAYNALLKNNGEPSRGGGLNWKKMMALAANDSGIVGRNLREFVLPYTLNPDRAKFINSDEGAQLDRDVQAIQNLMQQAPSMDDMRNAVKQQATNAHQQNLTNIQQQLDLENAPLQHELSVQALINKAELDRADQKELLDLDMEARLAIIKMKQELELDAKERLVSIEREIKDREEREDVRKHELAMAQAGYKHEIDVISTTAEGEYKKAKLEADYQIQIKQLDNIDNASERQNRLDQINTEKAKQLAIIDSETKARISIMQKEVDVEQQSSDIKIEHAFMMTFKDVWGNILNKASETGKTLSQNISAVMGALGRLAKPVMPTAQKEGRSGQKTVAETKSLHKRVKIVRGPDAGKYGYIRQIEHGLYKGAPKRYDIDLEGGGQANNLSVNDLRIAKDQQGNQLDELSKDTLKSYVPKRIEKTRGLGSTNYDKAHRIVNKDVPRAMKKLKDPGYGQQGVAEVTGDEKFDKAMRRTTGDITPDDAAEMWPTQEFEPYDLDPSRVPMEEKYKAKLFPLAYQYWTEGDNADELRALGWEPDYGDDYVMVVLSGIGHDGHIQYDKYDFDAEGEGKDEDEDMAEVAPPGAKAERMVKHIKKGYAKDGKITPKEKSIAYATAWKAHNKEINEEIEIRIIEMRMNGYEL